MSFPPQFLDELRTRLPVSEVVGRRVTLQRRGREFLGLCPFHSDSKPSMNVVDDKNFYHCFACGAHGDIIKFVMESEGLAFPEAVEKLADMAGLEVPKETPQDRERSKRRETLHDVLEHACTWFEQKLAGPGGAEALDYLRGRGLTKETIARFRLGWAPDSRTAFAQSMKAEGVKEALLLEAGLLRKPEDGGAAYDYFRGRIIFPITDRRGRVIAFGGRILGDGQPKYLNSPDTPVFHKGRVLYGLAQAREPARKADEIVVAEGYMDVIALSQGGFPQAVAPLGTALTEDQIAELWKLATEPVVCFDGDTAGMRAAGRAADRVLPMLKPGHSLRFVTLPQGEDPDDVIKHHGAKAMRELLDGAIPLSEFIWRQELAAQPVTTPERIADFQRRMRGRVREIAERTVQESYSDHVENRIREMRRAGRENSGGGRGSRRSGYAEAYAGAQFSQGHRANVPSIMARRQQQIVLAALLNHPALIDELGEAIGVLAFDDPFLDKLRQQIIEIALADPGLDSEGLIAHLTRLGLSDACNGLLSGETLSHAAFARRNAQLSKARAGLTELLARIGKPQLEAQLADAERAVAEEFSEASWNRLASLRSALASLNSSAALEETDLGRS
ncbi:DNA primase [Nisaea sediminum]|uniref:DNA primase n=1 Tax=Nisaea sediminum TaxID=2775867 RepID=UPI0018675006|nr:DNA primase [Nisaea sediminum]